MTTAIARRLVASMLCALAIAVLVIVSLHAQPPQAKPDVALKAAIDKEVVDGDLKAAIELYRKLADGTDRTVAAQALVRMGQCYEKLGASQSAEARKAYERLVRDFSDQKDASQQARARLAALAPAGGSTPAAPVSVALRRLYDGTGRIAPAVSRDGRRAVWGVPARWSNGLLAVRDLATGVERTIQAPQTAGHDDLMAASLGPDGRQIAYALATTSESATRSVIQILQAEGASPRILTTLDGLFVFELAWSDDARLLLAVASDSKGDAVKVLVLSVADGRVTELAPFKLPSASDRSVDVPDGRTLSPDGRLLAAVESIGGANEITLTDTRTGSRTTVAGTGSDGTNPLWTPDGKGLVYLRKASGLRSLWHVRVDAGKAAGPPELLKSAVGDIEPLQLTQDGSFVYWRHTTGFEGTLATLDSSGRNVVGTPSTLPGLRYACHVNWSPDSASIIYTARLLKESNAETAPCSILVIRSLEDGRERVLSPGLSNLTNPQWSPDGKRILLHATRDGAHGLYTIDADTGTATLIMPNGTNPTIAQAHDYWLFGFWAPNSAGFYWGRWEKGVTTIVHRDLGTGADTDRYTAHPDQMLWPSVTSVSPGGSVALLGWSNKDQSTPAIVLPADGGPARTVYQPKPPNTLSALAWAADGTALWAIRKKPTTALPKQRELLRIPVDGGEPAYAGLTMTNGEAAVWPSRDGTRLLIGAWPTIDEMWAMPALVPARK